jgi:hypothetical protein
VVMSISGFTICKPLSKTSDCTLPNNDFTPTLPASICLKAEDNNPIRITTKPKILKRFENFESGLSFALSVKLIIIKITPIISDSIIF